MRRLTLMLFQLFLSIFAVYAVLYDVPNEYLFVPVLPGTAPKRCLRKKPGEDSGRYVTYICSLYPKPPLILPRCSVGVFFLATSFHLSIILVQHRINLTG
jgi:hypothetical protein